MHSRFVILQLLVTSVSIIFIISGQFPKCRGETLEDAHSVLLDVFDNANYDKRLRGLSDQSGAVPVYASLMFKAIENFAEVSESLETMGVLTLSWIDERLRWKPSDYNGTRRVHVYQNDIWRPEVIVANPSQEITLMGHERIMVDVSDTGHAFWRIGQVMKTSCQVNVKAYPWDKQECTISLVVQNYLSFEVLLLGADPAIYMDDMTPNGQWDIESSRIEEENNTVSQLHFIFILRRRALFDVVILIVPTLALSVLNILVFCLPVQSGERMSYSITVLLSIAVLLTFVGDKLPKKSDNVAAICFCLLNILMMSATVCACTVLSLYLYHKGDEGGTPPLWLRRIIRVCSRNLKAMSPSPNKPDEFTNSSINGNDNINQSVKNGNKCNNENTNQLFGKSVKQISDMGNNDDTNRFVVNRIKHNCDMGSNNNKTNRFIGIGINQHVGTGNNTDINKSEEANFDDAIEKQDKGLEEANVDDAIEKQDKGVEEANFDDATEKQVKCLVGAMTNVNAETARTWISVSKWVDSVCFTIILLWLIVCLIFYSSVVIFQN